MSALPLPAASTSIDDDTAYRAWLERDASYDGRLFAGVTSTGIYCRPVCRVRMPRRSNLRFFANAASAQQAGFRPCLRCRPELAPGLSLVDSPQVLAAHAARMLEHAARSGLDLQLPDIAAKLGVTDRHLRRIFVAAHGVTPIDYWTNQRLLLAKQLLTDTTLPVTQIALQCGFASQRRFNAAFAAHCRMSPSRLRLAGRTAAAGAQAATRLVLAYRPPYDIDSLMRFAAARAIEGVETIDGPLSMRRTLRIADARAPGGQHAGWIALRFLPAAHRVELALAPSLEPALARVLDVVRQALDLDADPSRIDPVLARLPCAPREGLRLPGGFDGFETAMRVILGQQVTVKGARTLARRLVERFGAPLATPFDDLHRLFPDAATLAAARPADIGTLGIVRQRVGAIQALARAVADGRLALHRGAPLQATLDALRAMPGIGEWTVQVIAMRALAWPDAWPATDIGLHNALGSRDAKHVTALAEAWRPWRAYAVMRLWHHLENAT
ncbi:MAG TPA: Ada metal-binding domain-containing protein [Methylibium sp.]|uniref:Ada metal-binding domain-containing protein n=1 Tax=Methylibium sp. TaxID=2067992 RepID=UPI002DBD0C39|nr:Ada metal-binding domain-containing protein [Methylibium sp.]HEU4457859.1 Ada metal-binding domain-containing protein [Methylibium sp.]